MHRLIALFMGPLAMAALVYSFGFVSILVCFALALATLVFSNGPADDASARLAMAHEPGTAGEPTTFMGAL